MANLETTFEHPTENVKLPAVWQDKAGVVHRAVGAEVHRGIRLMWTACEKMDIPANAAWLQRPQDVVTCGACLAANR